MVATYERQKYSLDKVVLLGLLAFGLLMARFLTAHRSKILFSGPIKLSQAGLSVSMPSGNGWKSRGVWKYRGDSFTLSSNFSPRFGSITAIAHCRFQLIAEKIAADEQIEEKAAAFGGEIVRRGQVELDNLTIEWAQVTRPEMLVDMFFGIALLPNNRRLSIEVQQSSEHADSTEQLFTRIAESVQFEDPAGKIVGQIRDKGLSSFLEQRQGATFLIIKDSSGQAIGFTMKIVTNTGWSEQLNINAETYYYIRGRYPVEQAASFQCDDSLKNFAWKSQTSMPSGTKNVEMFLDGEGGITVKHFDRAMEDENYSMGPAAIPEIFIAQLLGQLQESGHKGALVDIVESEGKIVPAFISIISSKDTGGGDNDKTCVFRVELLDGRGYSEQVYLDEDGRISKIILQQESRYTLERSTLQDIAAEFPEREDYILQKMQELVK